jgi:hypothetical protein
MLTVILNLFLLAAPLAAEAQQAGKVWRIGLVSPLSRAETDRQDGFRRGMREIGYAKGGSLSSRRASRADNTSAFPRSQKSWSE